MFKFFAAIALSAAAIATSANPLFEKRFEFTQQELQKKLDEAPGPKIQKYGFETTFANPKIRIPAQGERIEIDADIAIEPPEQLAAKIGRSRFSGKAGASAGLRYDPEQGAFYLVGVKIENLSIDGAGDGAAKLARAAAQAAAEKRFASKPAHVLDDADLRQKLAKAAIKRVWVENGKLIALLGW